MSLQEINTKVCIIGAGLAGLVIANILNRYGIPCIVIEKHSQTELYARSGNGLVDYQTVSILREHDMGDRLLKVGTPHGKCEFRTPKHSFILNYAQMTEGQTHYTYLQQELLADLICKFQKSGGQILFETQAMTIANERYGTKVFCQQEEDLIINSDFVAGCDGFHGVARSFIPESVTQPQIIPYDYKWLAITAEAAPSTKHIIYGIHPRGFAGHMLHSSHLSHYYLQVPIDDTAADWSSDRIWAELQLRLAKNNWRLTEGKITEKQVLTMRSFATQTMQYQSIFLAGDAAHVVTPAGGKGIDLAIQDADVLAKAFAYFYRYQNNLPLKNYTATRLPEIRQAQEFSESLLHMINIQIGNGAGENNLLQLLQRFKLSQLMNSASYAQNFAKKYVGYVATEQLVMKPQANYHVRAISSKPLVIAQ